MGSSSVFSNVPELLPKLCVTLNNMVKVNSLDLANIANERIPVWGTLVLLNKYTFAECLLFSFH